MRRRLAARGMAAADLNSSWQCTSRWRLQPHGAAGTRAFGSMTERWKPKTSSKYVTRFTDELKLEYGGVLPEVEVTWEQWGDPTLPASRTVYIMPSFSNSSHVIKNLEGGRPPAPTSRPPRPPARA